MRDDRTEVAAWLERVHNSNNGDSTPIDTQTAEVAESGVDISQLRANLRLTPRQRLEKMVRAANFFASIRGTAQRREAR